MAVVYNRVIDILLQKNIITKDICRDALLKVKSELGNNGESATTGQRLMQVLIDDFNVDRHLVFREISRLYAFKEIDLKRETIDEARIEFIRKIFYDLPEETRNSFISKKTLPYKEYEHNKKILLFVSANPIDRSIQGLIRQVKNYTQFEIAYTKLEDILELIQKVSYYQNEFLTQIQESLQNIEIPDEESGGLDEAALDAEINRSMLTNLVEGALVEAVRRGASDIHIVPKEGNITEFYFRIDGKLQLWYSQDKVKPEAVAAVVKDRSMNIDRFDRSVAQDGYIQRKVDGCFIRFRVSVIPIVTGEFNRRFESIVIRVLDDRKVITNLNDLGLQKQAADDFMRAISQPQGMIILTGPTGSGKSTTLVAALHHVKDPSKNLITVEEPVEYMIPGTRQIRLNPKLNFDQALRSILRHDPDIVMVGEMRDLKSAEIGIALANTGHLTFSTLHTNDAPSAISRLYMLGVEPFLIANAINLIMAQRLIRRLCPKCKQVDPSPDLELAFRIGFTEAEMKSTTFYRPVGCRDCYGGFKGRIAIMEALYVTREIRRQILKAADEIDEDLIRETAIKNGMLTLRASGKERVKEGTTTIEEVIAATVET
ncbi:MAG: GspE/PulE family protein [candidate division KSB1 bacterium]|nr:GspE/PulE family protein [candidate division KSB1 bacterium]MDZ7319668.1 GspE/PulE family protein [candidate division KSB1 bacterium]MDZ7340738.1 GspE/PulE family protein [candidate division KSB1 bacterium]